MKLAQLTAFVAAAMLGVAQLAGAEEIKTGTRAEANAKKPLTRAQVLADLALWRQSGMQDLDREDGVSDTTSERYRQAMARYQALREKAERQQQVAAAPPSPR